LDGQAAGEVQQPRESPIDPATPWRSVCAPGQWPFPRSADRKEIPMNRVHSLTGGIVAALVLALVPSLALAGPSVHGHGKVAFDPAPFSVGEISIDAWLDDDGVAHGMMEFTGDALPNTNQPGGPSNPYYLEVTDLYIVGNTAYVSVVVVHALDGFIGGEGVFTFTDNSGTGDPDEINGVEIEAGNITVND
jgi:hypothetical protein